MSWKNWPYWLRGGIIFMLLDILIILRTLLQNQPFPAYADSIAFSLIFTHIPVSWFYVSLFGIQVDTLARMIPFLVVGLAYWFLIGTIVGWIVGKLNKK